jgi:hypothetical protein
MKYSKSYQSGHNEPVLLASSGAKPNIAKPNIAKPNIVKPKKQKNTPYGNKKEEFRRENFDESCMLAELDCFEGGDQEMCHFLETECGGGPPPPNTKRHGSVGTAGPGAECAQSADFAGNDNPKYICSSDAPYCMNYVANKQWGKCMKTRTGIKPADIVAPASLPTLGGLCTDLNYNCRLLASGAKDKEPYAPAIKGCREYATRCPNVFHKWVGEPVPPAIWEVSPKACEEIQKKCVTGNDQMCKQYSMHCAKVPISPAPVAFASDSPLVIKPTLTHDRHCHTLNTSCKYEDPDNLACREYAKLCPNVYPPHTESMLANSVDGATWGTYDRGTCESFQKACVTGVGTKSSEDCQKYSRHCANVPITATHPTAATATCEIEKSEIKNLHRTVSEVRSGCDEHARHLDEMLQKEFVKGADLRRAAQVQAEVHRAELDAAKAMLSREKLASGGDAAAIEKDIDSLQLVLPLINSLGPDPSPLTAEEEENDAVRAEIGAKMFVTSGDINSVDQFVNHVWKGIGWEWNGPSGSFENTTDTNESDSDNIFGVKYSSISRPNPPPNPPIFKMTESNIRLFRRKFAKRLYHVYYSFVLSDLSVVLKVCPDLAMHGSSETRSDSNFKESLKIFCGKEAGGFMERELGHHITILDNIRSEIDKYGGVVPPIQLIGQLKNLRSNFNRQMDMIKDKGFNYGKVTEAMSEGGLIEVEPDDFNIPTEDEERPLNKFETMVLSGKNRPPGIPDDIYKAAIQISFMSKQVCLNTESTKHSINRRQGSAEPSSKHSARAVFNCRLRRMDVFFDTVNKMIDANAADRAAVMDALVSKADREEILAETNLWPGWRELSTQHFNEVRNRRAQIDMDLYVMWVTRENSKPWPPDPAVATEEEIEEYNSTPTMSEAELEQIRYNMARDYSMEAIPGIDYKTMVNLLVTFNRWDFDVRQRPSETQGISAEGVGRGIGGPAEGTGGPAESAVREDIVLPPDTDVETFTVKAKEVILTIVRDETMPVWVYETIPAEIREEINSEHGLSLNTAKWSEIFHAMEPTNPEGLLSRGDPRDVSFIIWQRRQIIIIVSYVLRHLKNNEEWIISTMGELMAGHYKSNEYVSLAVEFFTLLGKSVGLEQNSDPNLGTLGARLTTLTADNLTLNETITDLQASLAENTCAVDIEDAEVAEIIDEAVEEITTLDSVTKKLTTQKKESETKLKKAEEDLAMRNKIIIGLAVFIFILIIVLLIK